METKQTFRLIAFFVFSWMATTAVGLWCGSLFLVTFAHLPRDWVGIELLLKAHQQIAAMPRSTAKCLHLAEGLAGLISILPIIFFAILCIVLRKKESLHGSARFANDSELAKSGLFPKKNAKPSKYPDVILGIMSTGRFAGKYLCFFGQQFISLIAPTRSGKGISAVITNLLHYRDSVVVLDIKGENFINTGGFRQLHGQAVFLFAPDGYCLNIEEEQKEIIRSHRWNPLSYIRRKHIYRDGDVMTIANILYPRTGDKDDIWNELAASLFKGLVLYLLDIEELGDTKVTLYNVFRLITPEGGLAAWMKREMADAKEAQRPLSEACVAEFNRFIAMHHEMSASVLSNLSAPLSIFSEAICAAATNGNDFDFREVRRKRMSIYLRISPGNLPKYDKLINLFFSQLIAVNTNTLPEQDPSLNVQCLLMLDEFASMGRVSIIAKSISYTAGYNMRFFLVFQSQSQLEEHELYGKAGTKNIMENCAVKLIFPPKEVDEQAKSYSETIGYKTVKAQSRSHSHGKHFSTSNSTSDQKRALLMPQEIVDLGKQRFKSGIASTLDLGCKQIVMTETVKPFIAEKIAYFDDPIFKERAAYARSHLVEVPVLSL